MKPCTGCHRHVLVTWALDGTEARYCFGCLRRALAEADHLLRDRELRRLYRRKET